MKNKEVTQPLNLMIKSFQKYTEQKRIFKTFVSKNILDLLVEEPLFIENLLLKFYFNINQKFFI
jgi:hypothetical protein